MYMLLDSIQFQENKKLASALAQIRTICFTAV